MQQLNRIPAALPPQAYKTYQVAAPLSTHFVPAACEEVDCPAWLSGWKTIVPTDSPQAVYIRRDSGRGFKEEGQPGGLSEFTFWPGQRCFASGDHKRRLERAERFLIRDGDWRGNPRETRPAEVSVTAWADDFGEHQEKLAAKEQEG